MLCSLLDFIGTHIEKSPRLELCLKWCNCLLLAHGEYLKTSGSTFSATMRTIHKSVNKHYSSLSDLCSSNRYLLEYITSLGARAPAPQEPTLAEVEQK